MISIKPVRNRKLKPREMSSAFFVFSNLTSCGTMLRAETADMQRIKGASGETGGGAGEGGHFVPWRFHSFHEPSSA